MINIMIIGMMVIRMIGDDDEDDYEYQDDNEDYSDGYDNNDYDLLRQR